MHFISYMGEIREDMHEVGWNVPKQKNLDWSKMINKVNMHIKSLNFGYSSTLYKQNITYYNSYATLIDKNTIKLVDEKGVEQKVTSKYILIAVGGRPNYLNIPNDKELCHTSDDIFWSSKEFGKTLVVGGGYIAMECAGFLNNFGK